MEKIQLLYVENIISRKKQSVQQTLYFFMMVENIHPDKQVDVIWRGEDGIWQTLPSTFHSPLDGEKEYWCAKTTVHLTNKASLPGNIEFSLRYQVVGQVYWDNCFGQNYLSQADSGVKLIARAPFLRLATTNKLTTNQRLVPITVVVRQSLCVNKVIVHWTTDDWLTVHNTPCYFKKTYWHEKRQSNARNPNQEGFQIWYGIVDIKKAFRLRYCISYECSDGRVLWDNHYGRNYVISRRPLKIMILNLHCYQEDHQDDKFSLIAKAINDLDVDVICFQEAAELWNDGAGDWPSNAAKIINDRLNTPFYIYTDWSHLGFDQYREGVAILSRYPFLETEARYVSEDTSMFSIHARKVIRAQINIPHIGLVNVFSAHLSWWEDGFAQQFEYLHAWATAKQTEYIVGTLLCGDFNITPGSKGYQAIMANNTYHDQFLIANTSDSANKIFQVSDTHWQNYSAEDYRIDYIFMNKTSTLKISASRVLFTDEDYGKVSDHCGYMMTFEPK